MNNQMALQAVEITWNKYVVAERHQFRFKDEREVELISS